jgi:hypothetical protein
MKVEWMFAHKLCALISRYQQRDIIANRDLFDIHYLFEKSFSPYTPIIVQRFTKMLGKKVSLKECIVYIIEFIRHHQKNIQKNILDGLGELIDEKDKKNIKDTLIKETLQKLQFYLSFIS